MKKYLIGIILGVGLSLGVTAMAAPAIKQYILTQADYPIIVKGVAYQDPDRPILTYEGSTYVPLAKLGDLTGVQYRWNEKLRQVEIDGLPVAQGDGYTVTGPNDPNVELAERDIIAKWNEGTPNPPVVSSGFVEVQGSKKLEAYDIDGKYMGLFGDDVDAALVEYDRDNELVGSEPNQPAPPPRLTSGWISQWVVEYIFKYHVVVDDAAIVVKSAAAKELIRLELPAGWKDKTNGDATANGVKLKKYDTFTYLNLADLQAAGVIK